MDAFHASFTGEAGAGESQSTAVYGHGVVNAARISMQHFLRHECPSINLVCCLFGDGDTTSVGDMHVAGVSRGRFPCRGWLMRDVYATVEQEEGGRGAARVRRRGA